MLSFFGFCKHFFVFFKTVWFYPVFHSLFVIFYVHWLYYLLMRSKKDNVWDLSFEKNENRKRVHQIFWWLLETTLFENPYSANGNVWNQYG